MKEKTKSFFSSVTLKIMGIGFLILILTIPTLMVNNLMTQRQYTKDNAIREMGQKWGYSQELVGPFLSVPYKSYSKNEKGEVTKSIRGRFNILPKKLVFENELKTEERYRGIYKAILYKDKLKIRGSFLISEVHEENIKEVDILWDEASFCFGLSDMRGIENNVKILFDNKEYTVNPGLEVNALVNSGFSSNIILEKNKNYDFSFKLTMRGSQNLLFAPLGENTKVFLKSDWKSPSFNGAFLPKNRKIDNDGFSSEWEVLHLNRNYPQMILNSQSYSQAIKKSLFGVKLLIPADIYQKSIRVSKYAIIFIIFTFLAFFFSEVMNKMKVHPLQYLLIGFAVMIFYILLLSISEHLGFDKAYLISAFLTTVLIGFYTKAVMKNKYFTLMVFGMLIILYGYFYIILQLEDYALLMGSIGLFLVLSGIMYMTRKIDWYSLNE